MPPTAAEPASHGRWRPLVAPAALLLLCAAVFSNALPREFVFDAKPIIAEHPLLEPDVPWWRLFVKTYWGDLENGGLYRPLTLLTYRVEKQWLGFDQPWQHAAVNIALHAAVALLLWRLALRWTRRRAAAFAAAALFAVHPVATEIVPNLVGRADLLVAIGLLAALLAWPRLVAARSPAARARWLAAVAASWTVGLLSKESAIILPGAALLLLAWRRLERPRDESSIRWPVIALAALGGLAAVFLGWYGWVTHHGPPGMVPIIDNPAAYEPWDVRVLTAVRVYGEALRVAFFPLHLSADYGFAVIPPVRTALDPGYLLGLAGLIATLAAAVAAWRRRSAVALGLAFFLLAYLPTSNLLFPIGTIFAERLLYVPLLGLCVAAGVAAAWVWRRAGRVSARGGRIAAALVFASVLIALGARSHLRNPVWHTHDGFFLQSARDAPRSLRMQSMAATIYAEREDTPANLDAAHEHAERAYRHALGLPAWARSRQAINLGATLLDRGVYFRHAGEPERGLADIARSIPLFQEALHLRAMDSPERTFIAEAQRWREARGLPRAKPLASEFAIQANLGKAYYELGRWREAAAALGAAAALEPQEWPVHTLWGRALANAGDLDGAAGALRRVAEHRPMDEAAWLDLLRVLVANGDTDGAAHALEEAQRLGLSEDTVDELRARFLGSR